MMGVQQLIDQRLEPPTSQWLKARIVFKVGHRLLTLFCQPMMRARASLKVSITVRCF